MKRRIISWLTAVCIMVPAMAPAVAVAESELEFPEIELELGTNDETRSEGDELGNLNDENAAIMESLGKKDWAALAAAAYKTGDWREDLVAVAESQIGYSEDSAGLTIYDARTKEDREAVEWTAMFISWVAEKAGLTKKQFPRSESYQDMRRQMNKLHALKKISRADYPVSGDLAIIEVKGQKLIGVIAYVANGYATIIHGDDNGKVTRTTYLVSGAEFKEYIDLNVLMERAGIEVGKGGDVPEIPEGGVAAWTNTKAVYLRSQPTTASKSLTTVKKSGTAVLVTSAALQEDGYIWYGVTYQSHQGYIRGDLLKLDMSAIPTGTPVPPETPAPSATPEPEVIPGCLTCVIVADGVALPVECCYEHLASMDRSEQVRFMSSLREADQATFRLYVNCHAAHVSSDAAGLICLGDACGEAAWNVPGSSHAQDCPWYTAGGLEVQERVVNVEVRESLAGQQITIRFAIEGAVAYQWHEVKGVLQADGSVSETDAVLEGETSDTITVTAKNEADTSYSYYCVATIMVDGVSTEVTGKTTVITLADAPVVASAVLGEEINFTYINENAAAYQWYIQAEENAAPAAIAADDPAYSGADSATLTFFATAGNSGALYFCTALDASGAATGTSSTYVYAIPAELRIDTEALGYTAELSVADGGAIVPAGSAFQWYRLVLSGTEEEYIALEGETSFILNVRYPLQEERYYCVYKDAEGNEKMSAVFVVVAQTTDMDVYLNTLYSDFVRIVIDEERPITDYAEAACQWMAHWDVTLDDGVNLAQKVLTYWYEYPDELLCSCIISGAVTADGLILGAHDQHDASCPWHVGSPVLSLTENTAADGSVYYTLNVTENGETTVVATTEMLDGVRHYFKDTATGLYVAWLRIDADGSMWIIPLEAEN